MRDSVIKLHTQLFAFFFFVFGVANISVGAVNGRGKVLKALAGSQLYEWLTSGFFWPSEKPQM